VKTESEVEAFKAEASKLVSDCPKCDGSLENLKCDCVRRFHFEVEAFEACIPQDFWYITTDQITHNVGVFERYVKSYVKRLSVAQRKGYGLLFSGSNGVGKTTFMSYILANAIRRGRSAYYTTLLRLDHDFKRGFDDTEVRARLEFMLSSDFLCLDEMTKEQFRALDKPAWIRTQIERILKQRFDENKPVLMATNAGGAQIKEVYGPTIASIITGKYQIAMMEPGDVRATLGKAMSKEMGWDDEA
jgi:DNA replication protein DnaC